MSTPYAIQKNVPIPGITRDVSSVSRKYDYGAMAVGDFFFVPGKEKNTLSSHASAAGKRLNRKFLTRLIFAIELEDGTWSPYSDDANTVPVTAETEGAEQGIGVWRLANDAPAPVAEPGPEAAEEGEEDEE